MSSEALFGLSILMSFVAFGVVTKLYIWPRLRPMVREEALLVLVIPHTFRFVGLSFLVPGVVSPSLSPPILHVQRPMGIWARPSLRFLPSRRSPLAFCGRSSSCGCSTYGVLSTSCTRCIRAGSASAVALARWAPRFTFQQF